MSVTFPLVASAMVGMMLGAGAFTFRYAEGLSYFSNNPGACANCHIMRDYLDSWQRSSHHGRAVCNDCHTPHAIIPKLLTKAENGWRHSVKFTLQTYPEPLRITSGNSRRLQENCVGCHGEFVSEIRRGHGPSGPGGAEESCVRCHPGVGHGSRR